MLINATKQEHTQRNHLTTAFINKRAFTKIYNFLTLILLYYFYTKAEAHLSPRKSNNFKFYLIISLLLQSLFIDTDIFKKKKKKKLVP